MAKQKRTFSSELGAGKFYPDLPKIALDTLLDHELFIEDARIVRGFQSQFGERDFCLLKFKDAEGAVGTVICGGSVVVKRIGEALAQRILPLYGTIVKQASDAGFEYYDIL